MNAPTEPTPAAREVTMTLADALAHAVQRHQAGDLDQAEPIYEAVLQRQPDRAEVLNYMGILKHQRGELAQAAALMHRLLQLQPEADGVWNNLGNVLKRLGRTDEAADAFERSLELVPSAHAWSNLARVFRKRGDLARSEHACLRALALEADHGPAMHNLALARILDGHVEPGVAAALRAMQLLLAGLGGVAQAVHDALRAGGSFVFTLEALAAGEGATHKLQDNGRYAHDGTHARRVFEAAGLRVDAPVEAVLREEKQRPVRGWLVVARRGP